MQKKIFSEPVPKLLSAAKKAPRLKIKQARVEQIAMIINKIVFLRGSRMFTDILHFKNFDSVKIEHHPQCLI